MNRRRKRRNKRNNRFFNSFGSCTYSSMDWVSSYDLLKDIETLYEDLKKEPLIKEYPVLLCTQEWFDKNKVNWKSAENKTVLWNLGIEIKIIDKSLLGNAEYRFMPKQSMDCFMPVMVNEKMVGISTFYKGLCL